MSETDLVYQILKYLDLCGVLAWRQNTGGIHGENDDGSQRYIPCGIPGQSDILGILPGSGRFLAIEVKKPGGRPTAQQWQYILNIQKAGGVAFWCDCLEAVQHALPLVQAGAWVATTAEYHLEITDEWTTSQALAPPKKARKKGARRAKPPTR